VSPAALTFGGGLREVLERAAGYIERHGLKSGSFGRPGGAVCVDSALALALGFTPGELGFGFLFRPRTTPAMRRVAEIVLEARLLEMLPVPDAPSWMRRKPRRPVLGVRDVLVELARWSDAPGRSANQAADALRAAAQQLQAPAELPLAA
jgi:hypothetical protein